MLKTSIITVCLIHLCIMISTWENPEYLKTGEGVCFHLGYNQNILENCHPLGETLTDIKKAALRSVGAGPSI